MKKRAAFSYVYRKGVKSSERDLLLLNARSREGLKIGLSVSKKVGNAVTRNRVKRLFRESLKGMEDKIDARYMYVLIARPSVTERTFQEVKEQVISVFKKAGRLND